MPATDQLAVEDQGDLLFSEPVADPLQSYRIIDGGEAVVQCGEPDPGLGGLSFGG